MRSHVHLFLHLHIRAHPSVFVAAKNSATHPPKSLCSWAIQRIITILRLYILRRQNMVYTYNYINMAQYFDILL